jgi:hypothetical protein
MPKTYIGEKTTSPTNGAEKTGYPHVEDGNQIPILPCKKIDSKWINDLNIGLKR